MNARNVEARARRVLSKPIGEVTSWIVITGAPSAGKTTLLGELAANGFRVSHDVSRDHLRSLLHRGGSKYEIRQNQEMLQQDILWKMLLTENQLPRFETVFLDYALPDNLAFWDLDKISLTAEVRRAAVRFRYRHVFIFDSLPLMQDDIRIESSDYQEKLTRRLHTLYSDLGYPWTTVPAAPVEKRLSIVLDIVNSLEHGANRNTPA